MTRIGTIDGIDLKPLVSLGTTKSVLERPTVVLATAAIKDEILFTNGLFQNIYVLYRMFESMGWLSFLLVNKKPDVAQMPSYMRDIRQLELEQIVKQPIPVRLYIEIGMSIDGNMRRFLKMCGARVCKLYLGNILNIDIETPIYYQPTHFAHHVIGDLDEIWVSPHYYQHAEYARALNHVAVDKPTPTVAPYVWDSQILTADGTRRFAWRPPANSGEERFLILEPNISFQKNSLVPLMILEYWFRAHPDWNGKVIVVNGERLMGVPFFKKTVWETLELVKKGRVEMRGRMDILSVMSEFPSGYPVCHQWNNEYNYMALEFFWAGMPVLHNASDWSAYGYYYPNSDIRAAAEMVERIRGQHAQNLETYKSHARSLLWRHSPYNPDVQRAWAALC